MQCPYCGRENAEQANFCSHCGRRLSAGQESKANRPLGWIIIELFILLAFVLFFLWQLPEFFQPEYQAELFFHNLASQKTERAFRQIQPEEKKGRAARDMAILSDHYQLSRTGSLSLVRQDEAGGGKAASPSPSFYQWEIHYRLEGEEEERVFPLTMKRQKEKLFGRFDQWRFSLSPYLLSDVSLYLPHGAAVKWDGQKLEKAEGDPPSAEHDTYQLKGVIAGRHQLQLELAGFQPYIREVELDEGQHSLTLSLSDLTPQPLFLDQLLEQALSNVGQLWQAAGRGEAFDAVAPFFAVYPNNLPMISWEFGQLKEKVADPNLLGIFIQSSRAEYFPSSQPYYEVKVDVQGKKRVREQETGQERETDFRQQYSLRFLPREGKWYQLNLGLYPLSE